MQTVSWLVICGSGPVLVAGMYPSAIAQTLRPIVFMQAKTCKCGAQAARHPERSEGSQNAEIAHAVIPSVARDLGGRWLDDQSSRPRSPRSLATLGMTGFMNLEEKLLFQT